jgi:hypothetical protein
MWKNTIRIVVAVVVGVQVGLWLLGGKSGPLKAVPKIIAHEIEVEQREYRADTGKQLVDPFHSTIVICPLLDEAIGPCGFAALQGMFSPLQMSVIHESDAPRGWDSLNVPEALFIELCAEVIWQTPLVAQIDVIERFPYETGGTGHRVWFLSGFWVHGGETYTW